MNEPPFFPDLATECRRIAKQNTVPLEIQLGADYFAALMNYLKQMEEVPSSPFIPILIKVNGVRYVFNPNLPPQSYAILFRYL